MVFQFVLYFLWRNEWGKRIDLERNALITGTPNSPDVQEAVLQILGIREKFAEMEQNQEQTLADWKQERERMEGEIQRMRTAADQAVKLIDRACIVSRHKAIMERLMAASETLRAALGKTV